MKREEKQKFIEEKIIKAILNEMDKRDLDAITTEEIAEAASVSKRTLYKYYSSKTEMYLAIVDYCFQELSTRIERRLETISQEDPFAILECIGRCHFEYSLQYPVKGTIIATYNELDYIQSHEAKVQEISIYANRYAPSHWVDRFYQYYQITPRVKKESISLFLWSSMLGLSTLLLSKGSWIEAHYKLNRNELIEDYMKLLKITMLGDCYEKE